MRGERGDGRGDAAMRDGDPGGAGNGRERGDTRDHVERHAGLRERERLLPAAAEEERVAALEPHDVVAAAAERNEQLVDLFLLEAIALDAQRVGRRFGDEPAVETATVMSPRRCMAGRMNVHSSGTSSTLQKIRRALASAKTRSPCSTSTTTTSQTSSSCSGS